MQENFGDKTHITFRKSLQRQSCNISLSKTFEVSYYSQMSKNTKEFRKIWKHGKNKDFLELCKE